jgi:large subunit ribosomal protein L21
MAKFAVVQTGGKQYLVQEGQHIVVEHIDAETGTTVELTTLAVFDNENVAVDLGAPELAKKTKASVLEQGKGEKIRIAKFKSKVDIAE